MRKILAGLGILGFIGLWIFIAGTLGSHLSGAPAWLQLGFYVIAGVAWVIPLKPLLAWMNRPQPSSAD